MITHEYFSKEIHVSKKNGPTLFAPDQHPLPTGGSMDKIAVYGWEMVDKPGKFMKISKRELNIDHDYQRDNVRHTRVNRIASQWSWVRFGCLLVARRPDGTHWVFDGQHRKLAADKRSDVDELPCMVYMSTGPQVEARLFLDVGTDRGSITMLDRFKALLAQNDQTAVQVRDMVQSTRYRIMQGGARNTVRCAGVLMQSMKADPDAAKVAWRAVVAISEHEYIQDRVYQGLYTVERHLVKLELGSLADTKFRPIVERLKPKTILLSITQTSEYHGKGGPKVYGEAIVRLMNKGRRNTIPSLYSDNDEGSSDEEHEDQEVA